MAEPLGRKRRPHDDRVHGAETEGGGVTLSGTFHALAACETMLRVSTCGAPPCSPGAGPEASNTNRSAPSTRIASTTSMASPDGGTIMSIGVGDGPEPSEGVVEEAEEAVRVGIGDGAPLPAVAAGIVGGRNVSSNGTVANGVSSADHHGGESWTPLLRDADHLGLVPVEAGANSPATRAHSHSARIHFEIKLFSLQFH